MKQFVFTVFFFILFTAGSMAWCGQPLDMIFGIVIKLPVLRAVFTQFNLNIDASWPIFLQHEML